MFSQHQYRYFGVGWGWVGGGGNLTQWLLGYFHQTTPQTHDPHQNLRPFSVAEVMHKQESLTVLCSMKTQVRIQTKQTFSQ